MLAASLLIVNFEPEHSDSCLCMIDDSAYPAASPVIGDR